MKTVAIMQPTYLPWLGYFDMMDQSDVFVLLDSVQFDKRSWQQRNRVKTPNGELFLTVPVFSKGKYIQKIGEVEIDTGSGFQEKHIKTIEHSYAKAPYFAEYAEGLATILNKKHRYLVELTAEFIAWLKEILGIQSELVFSSSSATQGSKVELLVSICQQLGADRYISPPGSKTYIEANNLFAAHDIELCYHDYQHPTYRQLFGSFVSHLSVLDLLFNQGEQSMPIIRSGRVSQ